MARLRDILVGVLVLAAVFVTAQGAVGYLGFPRKSLVFWVVPGLAVVGVVAWYMRPAEDWTSGPDEDDRGEGGDA